MLARSRKLVGELRELSALGLPLVITFAGNNLLGVVDTAMVGRLGPAELAGVALGNAVFFTFAVAAMGFVFGIDPLISQAVGAGEGQRARAGLRAGMRLGLLLSLPTMLILALAPLSFRWMGVASATAAFGSQFLWARTLGVVPFLLIMAQRSYLQGRAHTRPLVWATLAANLVNVAANGWLIFGGLGIPPLGVLGAGLASNFASFIQLAIVGWAIHRVAVGPGEGNTNIPLRLITRIGGPIALTLLAEVGAFSIVGILATRIGASAGSGHQVAITLASLTFTVSLGLSAATSVRVGQAVGRGDAVAARRAGAAGLFASGLYMGTMALVFLLFAPLLARAMSDNEEVIAAAVPLLYIAAAFQLFDGAQVVAGGALRGLGETRFIQYANIIGYYLLGLPLSLLLAFSLGWNERGLWWGLSAGLAFVAATLTWKFERLSRGPVARLS